ncbi:MAG: hypothetical protein K8R67_19025 [Desulfobacteraceae bacterium]|nr:hypothetical protein [Desulfobacteraceae bacterium]
MKLESELNSLSKRAKNLITPPQLDIASVLSQKKNSNLYLYSFRKLFAKIFSCLFSKPAISFAAIVLCVLSILYLTDSQQKISRNSLTTESSTEALLTEIERDLEFAETINKLEDYALSGFITLSDNHNYNLDEFIEYVAPTTKETI